MTLAPEHAELNEHLNAYVDRAVDEPVRQRLTAHLTDCATCRADLAQLRATRDAVRHLPTLRAPRPFTLPEPVGPRGTPAGPPPWVQGAAGRQSSAALPRRRRAGWILTWTWRLGALGATICLLISLTTFATPAPRLAATGAADTSSSASSGQPGQPGGPAPALAERDSSQRVGPAAQSARPGVPQAPAPASEGTSGTPSEVARSPASPAQTPNAGQSSAARWLALAFVLALPSAALFALDRRAARVGVR